MFYHKITYYVHVMLDTSYDTFPFDSLSEAKVFFGVCVSKNPPGNSQIILRKVCIYKSRICETILWHFYGGVYNECPF